MGEAVEVGGDGGEEDVGVGEVGEGGVEAFGALGGHGEGGELTHHLADGAGVGALGVGGGRAGVGGAGGVPAVAAGEGDRGFGGGEGVDDLLVPVGDGVGEEQELLGGGAVFFQLAQAPGEAEPGLGEDAVVQGGRGLLRDQGFQDGDGVGLLPGAGEDLREFEAGLGGAVVVAVAVEAGGGLGQVPDGAGQVAGVGGGMGQQGVGARDGEVGVAEPGRVGHRPAQQLHRLLVVALLEQDLAEQCLSALGPPGRVLRLEDAEDGAQFRRRLVEPSAAGGEIGSVRTGGGGLLGESSRAASAREAAVRDSNRSRTGAEISGLSSSSVMTSARAANVRHWSTVR